ncbi:flavodoxin family protein [Lactiplantibacillus plantarum]|nr:flavodoxin [Lactiplantibacillus plantarum]MCZ2137223.1 flavodoxin [Lactiplantibacillus plantarum]MCZ2273724.1 flavodoxin [Lactiplantibacillus plantarum]WNJ66936.1 flavodoxin [Lactiplantibacillus plantarum]
MNTQLPKGRGAISDGKDTNLNEAPTRLITKNAKTLVIYFSRSGNTEYQAKIAQEVLHADSYELIAKNSYATDYDETVNRSNQEQAGSLPELVTDDLPNFEQYDLLLLGSPIWSMTLANPMQKFLEQFGRQLSGKRIAEFTTNAGFGAGNAQQVLKELTPAFATVLNEYTIKDTEIEETNDQFKDWLQETEEK